MFRVISTIVCICSTITYGISAIAQAQPEPYSVTYYIPFDNSAESYFENYRYPTPGQQFPVLQYGKGVIGSAASFAGQGNGILYPVPQALDPEKGTISLWVKLDHAKVSIFCMIVPGTKITDSLGCLSLRNKDFLNRLNDGKWHHCVYTWDLGQGYKYQYLDGKLVQGGRAYYRTPYLERNFRIAPGFKNWMDEFILLDRALSKEEVENLYRKYKTGKQPFETLPSGDKDYCPVNTIPADIIRSAPPPRVKWSATKTDSINKVRERVSLAGYWRFQPMPYLVRVPVSENWLYVKIPSSFCPLAEKSVYNGDLKMIPGFRYVEWKAKKEAQSSTDNMFSDDDNALPSGLDDLQLEPESKYKKTEGTWDGKPFNTYCSAFLEREFSLPRGAQEKLVLLRLANATPQASVYINGTFAGVTRGWDDSPIDITPLVKPDASNTLTLLMGSPFTPLAAASIRSAPTIELRESRAFLAGQPLIVPSFRNTELKVLLPIDNVSDNEINVSVTAELMDKDGEKVEKEIGPVQATIPKDIAGEDLVIKFSADGLKEWTPETPNLYSLVLRIEQNGKLVDMTTPERFGFREVWVENGNIMLNGKRYQSRGKSHAGWPSLKPGPIELMKNVGMNSTRIFDWEGFPNMPGLDYADELGITLNMPMWLNLSDKEEARKALRKYLSVFGNHPCIIEWMIGGRAYHNGPHGHPMQIGGLVSNSVRETVNEYKISDTVNEIDPTGRLTFFYTSGVGGNVRGIMHSLSYGTPIQEIEEWISYWAGTRQDPFFPREQQIFSRPDFFFQRGSSESVVLEHYARYFGDRAYTKATDPVINAWQDIGESLWATPEYWTDFYDLAYTRALRSWRTYGISGFWFHASYHMQSIYEKSRNGGPLTDWGKAIKRFNAPCIFYIGGPQDDFVDKSHNYFSQESVLKNAIVVNDTLHDIEGDLFWEASSGQGLTLGSSSATVTVPRGTNIFRPIAFKCPEARQRTEAIIHATFKSTKGDINLEDTFRVAVFPTPPTPDPDKPLAVFDSSGDTVELLKKMKLPLARITEKNASQLSSFNLLVIGRNSYDEATGVFDNDTLNKGIRAGMNVLVLEQMNRNVAGLTVECFNTRRVFILRPTDPLLAGFKPEDFIDWRWESTMLPPYMSWCEKSDWRTGANLLPSKHGQANTFRQGRFWHWSNKGTVCTFCYQKPQRGNFDILLQNGFDELYTPLVRFEMGKGCVVFSQLDLLDHYGKDPVATILLSRMLATYSKPHGRDLKEMGFIGGDNGRAFMKLLGVDTKDSLSTTVAYASLSEIDDTKAISEFVNGGGTLVVSISSPEDAAKLPVKVKVEERRTATDKDAQESGSAAPVLEVGLEATESTETVVDVDAMLDGTEKANAETDESGDFEEAMGRIIKSTPDDKEYFTAIIPDNPAFAGVSLGDLYYRLPSTSITRVVSIGAAPANNELIGIIPYGKGRIIYIQPDPDLYDDPWQKTKIIRLYNTVFTNLGVKNKFEPDFKLVGGLGIAKEWLPGYWADIKEEVKTRPEVKESPLYLEPALDFDPNCHYVW